jgi:hypothetical protein
MGKIDELSDDSFSENITAKESSIARVDFDFVLVLILDMIFVANLLKSN